MKQWFFMGLIGLWLPPCTALQIDVLDLSQYSVPEKVADQETLQRSWGKQHPKSAKSLRLSIDVIRQFALANNLKIELLKLSPTIADTFLAEESAKFEAAFFSTVSHRKNNPLDFSSPGELNSSVVGTTIPLKTGGIVEISIPVGNLTTPRLQAQKEQIKFKLDQPLLRNRGQQISRASIKKFSYQKKQSLATTKLQIINELAGADRLYWRLWLAWRQVEISHEQHQIALKQLDIAERLVKADIVAGIEITRSKVGISQRVEAMIIAEVTRRRLERDLKRVMQHPDIPLQSAITLIPETNPSIVALTFNKDQLITQALQNRMELLEAELQLDIDSINQKIAKNQLLSDLTLSLEYSYNRLNTDVYDHHRAINLNFNIPFGNKAAKNRLKRASIQRIKAIKTLHDRRLTIRQDVLNSLDFIQQNWQRILAAKQEEKYTTKIHKAEIKQFKRGIRTSTQVLEAAQFVANAQLKQASAIADYEIAKIDLAIATGTLLGLTQIND